MVHNVLISTDELEQFIGLPNWKIIDCRFDLNQPDWGRIAYLNGHIPGSIYADLNKDLTGEVTDSTGRHPLPSAESFIQTLMFLGLERSNKVVVYDSQGGAFAARLWWMLQMLNHDPVFILDGGFPKWTSENRAIQTGNNVNIPGKYECEVFDNNKFCTTEQLLSILDNSDILLIDSRSPERFRGEIEPIDPIAGHIPHAINRFHGNNLAKNGNFKSPSVLYNEFMELLGEVNPENAIYYCGSGVTSCHQLLATRIANLPDGKVYVGSWSEWIRDPDRPIITQK